MAGMLVLAAENGNNAPGNSDWNSRPRIYVFMKAGENLLKCVCISAHRKSVKPEAGKLACITGLCVRAASNSPDSRICHQPLHT